MLVIIWCLLSLAAIGALAPQGERPPIAIQVAAILIWGSVVGMGARFGFFLRGARNGQLDRFHSAPDYRLWKLFPVSVVVGALCAAFTLPPLWLLRSALGYTSNLYGALPFVGLTTVTIVFLMLQPNKHPNKGARKAHFFRWICLDTGLPVGCISAMLGYGIGRLRFWEMTLISPEMAGKHLAFTCIIYGTCLGSVGFMKAYSEIKSGLVQVEVPRLKTPGPLVLGIVLAVSVIWLVPRLDTPLQIDTLLGIKVLLGLFLGACLCSLGALRGAIAAQSESTTKETD